MLERNSRIAETILLTGMREPETLGRLGGIAEINLSRDEVKTKTYVAVRSGMMFSS